MDRHFGVSFVATIRINSKLYNQPPKVYSTFEITAISLKEYPNVYRLNSTLGDRLGKQIKAENPDAELATINITGFWEFPSKEDIERFLEAPEVKPGKIIEMPKLITSVQE
ncbi:MAG: hypothetical protein K1X68_10775 [Saprospiraceae bacterium]|nr:hypothetical protein [Saprospiraceae bacterium]HMW40278.1 hypothetical protein [Saprospiraceae bacterium]HMX87273.1 hypothetical protein [Saprospiraceae bacterium]HMZ40756.1 hypothetical protein [Saprospiraceae bacterium]HNA64892.1 hypothetical protein [Saprospiraceae bacterium]